MERGMEVRASDSQKSDCCTLMLMVFVGVSIGSFFVVLREMMGAPSM